MQKIQKKLLLPDNMPMNIQSIKKVAQETDTITMSPHILFQGN